MPRAAQGLTTPCLPFGRSPKASNLVYPSSQQTINHNSPINPDSFSSCSSPALCSRHRAHPSRTTHDSNKPTPPSCPPTAQGGPGSGLNAGAGRKFACLRPSPGSWPAAPAAGMEGSGVQLPATAFSRAPQLSHGYKSINKRSVCRHSSL